MAHINEKMLQAYSEGILSRQEGLQVMEHIAGCDSCAARFAGMMSKEKLVSPPPDLKREILVKTVCRKSPAQAVRRMQERKRERQREFLAYSARVVFAMAASVLIVFTMSVSTGSKQREMPVEIVQMRQQEKPEAERKNLISGSLQKASGKMGDALQGFLNLFGGQEEEERE
ncbi:MAG: hypothetical protein HFH72_12405 [Lachnospiraceae bacterium]|nr:hypothetical protein [Lachnospiraceae bacterium]